jgi:hypothetical protein
VVWLGLVTPVAAQGISPGPPGPFVVDIRGATIGLPQAAGFYPVLPQETAVPARGFGLETGAHVYFLQLGPGRLGAGASLLYLRGTADGVSMTARLVAPQVSINFGTSNGWSYISGGAGAGHLRGRLNGDDGGAGVSRSSGGRMTINVGGGARWFVSRHIGIGFDLRAHRIAGDAGSPGEIGTPAAFVASASVGLSLR